ncbi:hypothetical protein LCGC14_0838650 [marine sediment metagenome]|uniref:Diaminobutyrate--2-oxoglutarate transaminase n=1 Tax=marine sediment metagenome TaxID=412755 RepID=A0A0F9RYG9_9ZZZZ
MNILEHLESNVRTYSRAFPAIFTNAKGVFMYDDGGKQYIDLFAGAGVINYGHNNPRINGALIEYLQQDGILHSLDMFTSTKVEFVERFNSIILEPRAMKYKLQFCGPTGANAVEAALKLSRKRTGQRGIVAFSNAFHGLSMGALSVTGNQYYRNPLFLNSDDVTFAPYDGYYTEGIDTSLILRQLLTDKSSGLGRPAAIILETVQAEGGINVASVEWLREIERICHEFEILMIVDDIQVGNGRTGDFFSFERSGISPDIIVLSKALGGGMPMSLLLMKPEHDVWEPGEHTGTFRGNNLAFVAGATALRYWKGQNFSRSIKEKGCILGSLLETLMAKYPGLVKEIRGCGLIQGLVIAGDGVASRIAAEAFDRGVVIEVAGARDQVLKFMPPLIIDTGTLREGVAIVSDSLAAVAAEG